MSAIPAANTVGLSPEGFVEVKIVGDQSYQSIDQVNKECQQYIQRLQYEHKPVLGLIDFTKEAGYNTGSNKAAMEALAADAYDRVALFGDNKILVEVAELIVKAMGKSTNTKVFHERDEALAWLFMKDPLAG
jgi:hypothetical protein